MAGDVVDNGDHGGDITFGRGRGDGWGSDGRRTGNGRDGDRRAGGDGDGGFFLKASREGMSAPPSISFMKTMEHLS